MASNHLPIARGAGDAVLNTDVAILGAGPAGTAAARLLAGYGHSVVVLGRPNRQPPLAESLPPSCNKLFDEIGVRHAIERSGFVRATGNTVRWGNAETRIERFDREAVGYQVERDAFDALLGGAAQAAGASVRPDAAATQVERRGDRWHISVSGDELSAGWVLDATGRAGLLARRGLRETIGSSRMTAIAAIWERDDDWPIPEPTHTVVESYDGGWGWSVPDRRGRRYVTVMLDPLVTPISRKPGLGEAYAGELSRTDLLRSLTEGARLVGSPWGCDASPYTATRAFDDHALLVGDASSFVDPLSSFGVKKALASGWLGAVAVNTAINDSAMTATALELFAARERTMFTRLQQQAAALASDAAGAHPTEFWTSRADVSLDDASSELDVSVLRRDPRVLAAFDEIKRRDVARFRPADGTRVIRRGVVHGSRIVLEDHLTSPALAQAVRYCRNIDLLLLARLAPEVPDVAELYEAYNRAGPSAALPDFLGALSALVGLEVLALA